MDSGTVKIKILGLGGAGTNAVRDLLKTSPGSPCAAIDTDLQSLLSSVEIDERLLIKSERNASFLKKDGADAEANIFEKTDGSEKFGAKFSPEISLKDGVLKIIEGAELLIILAGLGGDTGGELAAAISHMAKKRGILAVAFCIFPFSSEGEKKSEKALEDFYAIKASAAAIALPNDITLPPEKLPISEAFRRANSYANSAVKAISQMAEKKGIVNLDFGAFRKMFSQKFEHAVFCMGSGEGENYLEKALRSFDACPIFHSSEPKKLLVNFNCPPDFDVSKMNAAFGHISQKFGKNSDIAFGACIGETLGSRLEICALGVSDEDLPSPLQYGREEKTVLEKPAPQKEIFENSSGDKPAKTFAKEENSSQSSGSATAGKNLPEKLSEPAKEKTAPEAPAQKSEPSEAKPSEQKKFGFFGFGQKNSKKNSPASSKDKKISENQSEFAFVEMEQQRGFFLDTPPNMRGGVDLDIPTYLRKNIKITL